jgi:hypothetical protein
MKTTQVATEKAAHDAITILNAMTPAHPTRFGYLSTLAPSVLRVMADVMYAPCDAPTAYKPALIRAILAADQPLTH